MVENYQCRRISWTLLSRLSNALLCFCPFYLFRFPVKGEYVDIHFVTSYHGFFSCHFDLVDYLCIVEWFFFHQRTVLWWCYVCNKLEMFKICVLFWCHQSGYGSRRARKDKESRFINQYFKVVSWFCSCEIKVLSSAESSVLWDRFCEGLV